MTAFLKFLAALAAVALLAVAAFLIDGAPGSAASAERRLEESAREALGDDAAAWASVTMDGQKAILSGEAPDDEARADLIARIAAAQGGGGLVSGGVTAVDAGALTVVEAPPTADPFLFIAEYENSVLAFSGHAPDQETRDEIFRLAHNLFPDTEISGGLEIARGAPASPESWGIAAETSLRALYYLRHGAVSAENERFSVMGEAEDTVRAGAARMLMTALPEGLAGEAEIFVDEETPVQADPAPRADAPAPASSMAAQDNAPAASAAPAVDCLAPLRNAVSVLNIRYSSADSGLDDNEKRRLREVATLLSACPGARLRITGHTDSLGSAPGNLLLSRERARIVGEFLVSAGAAPSAVAADGAGESEPLANNATEEGRERNRRIEFEIISG